MQSGIQNEMQNAWHWSSHPHLTILIFTRTAQQFGYYAANMAAAMLTSHQTQKLYHHSSLLILFIKS